MGFHSPVPIDQRDYAAGPVCFVTKSELKFVECVLAQSTHTGAPVSNLTAGEGARTINVEAHCRLFSGGRRCLAAA